MDFKNFIKDVKQNSIVFAFEHMNPPSMEYSELISKIKAHAKSLDALHEIVLQHSFDNNKHPLNIEQKLFYASNFFPKTNFQHTTKESPSILHYLSNQYNNGVENVVLYVNEHLIENYKKIIGKYNGSADQSFGYFKFDNIEFIPYSIQEKYNTTSINILVENNNYIDFKKYIPYSVSENITRQLFNDIRKNMSIKEVKNIRERYLNGEIYNLGDIVETNDGKEGEIIFRGSTYLTLDINGKNGKYWLKDIKEKTEYSLPAIIPPVVQETYFNAKAKFLNKIPALLMTKAQLEEMQNSSKQITYMGYTSKNLDLCPNAFSQLKELITKGDKNPKYILQALQAFDKMFEIEKLAIKKGFANEQLVHEFVIKMSIAHDTMNMLGYDDKDLEYIRSHLNVMSKLSLHRDSTFANELGTHTPVVSEPKDIEEDIVSTDFRVIPSVTSTGKPFYRKVRARRIRTSQDLDFTNELPTNLVPVQYNNTTQQTPPKDTSMTKKTLTSFKKVTEAKKMMKGEDPCWDGYKMIGTKKKRGKEVPNCVPTNESSNYIEDNVYAGVEKIIPDQGHPEKPIGLVSFKSFASKNLDIDDKVREVEKADIAAADIKSISPSPSYKTMRKANLMDN